MEKSRGRAFPGLHGANLTSRPMLSAEVIR